MCLSKNKCVALNNGNQGYFVDEDSGLKNAITFNFDKLPPSQGKFESKGSIVQILMHEIYVIVIYETCVAIFNAQTGDFLEERGNLERFKYKVASLNHATGDIILIAHNNSSAKNIINTKIY